MYLIPSLHRVSDNSGEVGTSLPEKHEFKYLPCMRRRVELCPPGSGAFALLIYNWNQVLWVTFTTACELCFCFGVAIHHEFRWASSSRHVFLFNFFPPNQKQVDAIRGHARVNCAAPPRTRRRAQGKNFEAARTDGVIVVTRYEWWSSENSRNSLWLYMMIKSPEV